MTPTEPAAVPKKRLDAVAVRADHVGRRLRSLAIGLGCAALVVAAGTFGFDKVLDRLAGATSYQVERGAQADCLRDINVAYELAKKDNDLAVTHVVNVALNFGEGPELDDANDQLESTSTALDAAGARLEHQLEICPPVDPPDFAD